MIDGAPAKDLHPFQTLTPERIESALVALGFEPDGRLLALNSYENRVYRIGLVDREPVVAKFYRPGRWSDAAILEEHAFTRELACAEVPVAAPLVLPDGGSLAHLEGFRIAVYPRVGGRAPEIDRIDVAEWLGRTIARLHLVGGRAAFAARQTIDAATLIAEPAARILRSAFLPGHLDARFSAVTTAIANRLAEASAALAPRVLRLHGDLHLGNMLWRDQGPLLVDFDDAATGPAVQDLFLLDAGSATLRDALIEGYTTIREFDAAEWTLAPWLALGRQVHYGAWVAARWDDPAFPRTFPWIGEARWWEGHVNDLERALED